MALRGVGFGRRFFINMPDWVNRPHHRCATKSVVGSYSRMSSKADHYRGQAKECCLNAVLAEDINRRVHWLEAAARLMTLGRQEGVLTTPSSASVLTTPLPSDPVMAEPSFSGA